MKRIAILKKIPFFPKGFGDDTYTKFIKRATSRRPKDYNDVAIEQLIRTFEANGFTHFESNDYCINYHEDSVRHSFVLPNTNISMDICVYKDNWDYVYRRVFISIASSNHSVYGREAEYKMRYSKKVVEKEFRPQEEGYFECSWNMRHTAKDIVSHMLGAIRKHSEAELESASKYLEITARSVRVLEHLEDAENKK